MTKTERELLTQIFTATVGGKFGVRVRAWLGTSPSARQARRRGLLRLQALGLVELFTARGENVTHVRMTDAGRELAGQLAAETTADSATGGLP